MSGQRHNVGSNRRIGRGFWLWLAGISLLLAYSLELIVEQRILASEALSDAELVVQTHRQVMEGMLAQVESDIVMLSSQSVLQRVLGDSGLPRSYQDAVDSLIAFSAAKPIYAQVRLLDESGMELIRVDSIDGQTQLVPEQQLQDKSSRYYFKEGLRLPQDTTYTSPLDLNVERGEIEEPRNPMLRLVRGVYDHDDNRIGFMVLNLYGRLFIDYLASVSTTQPGIFMLADNNGNWLFAGNPDVEWAMMYPAGSVPTASDTLEDAWPAIQSKDQAAMRVDNTLVASTTITPFSHLGVANGTGRWHLVLHATFDELGLVLPKMMAPRLPFYIAVLALVLFAVHKFTDVAIDRYRYRERLKRLAVIDELTGIPNRRYLFDEMNRIIARLGRNDDQQLGLLFVDLDNFKPINDQHGHEVGDAVLVACAKRIAGSVRQSDFAARYGGDEFVVVLPETGGIKQIEAVASKLIESISQPLLTSKGSEIYVGVSVGLFSTEGTNQRKVISKGADELIRIADRAMYHAKDISGNSFAWPEAEDYGCC